MRVSNILISFAFAIVPRAVHAEPAPCPPEKSQYAYEWTEENEETPATRIVYKVFPQHQGELRVPTDRVSFETWRNSKLVWSIGGEVFCSDVAPMCNLTLDRRKNPKSPELTETCGKFPIFVEDIAEGGQIQYLVFGGLAAYTMACGEGLDIQVKAEDQFTEMERKDKYYILAPTYRYEGCKS